MAEILFFTERLRDFLGLQEMPFHCFPRKTSRVTGSKSCSVFPSASCWIQHSSSNTPYALAFRWKRLLISRIKKGSSFRRITRFHLSIRPKFLTSKNLETKTRSTRFSTRISILRFRCMPTPLFSFHRNRHEQRPPRTSCFSFAFLWLVLSSIFCDF